MNLKGIQIAIDMYGCLEDIVANPQTIETILKEATDTFSMEAKSFYFNQDVNTTDLDYSYIVPCKKGHLNVYVYPNLGFVAVDVFTCNQTAKAEKLAIFLRNKFSPDKAQTTFLDRGNFGSKNDMKPRKKSLIKTSRRAKTARDKILKILFRPKSI